MPVKPRFCVGDRSQFPATRLLASDISTDDTHVPQYIYPWLKQILFFGIPAYEDGRRQFLFVQDDDHVIGRAGDRTGCRLIGNVEELQRAAGYFDFKKAVDRGDRSQLKSRHANLHIFYGLALFIDNTTFDGDVLLRR